MESEPSSSIFLFSTWIFLPLFVIVTTEVLGALVLVLLLLFASAMISGSEIAFFSLTHNDFAILREEKGKAAQRILKLKEKPRTLLATILISNNFINIGITLIADLIVRETFSLSLFNEWAEKILKVITFTQIDQAELAGGLRFSIVVVGVTFLLVLFGEVAPKIYAKLNNILLAKRMSGALIILMKLFSPLSKFLVGGTSIIERKLEKRTQSYNAPSKEDIDEAINLTVSQELNVRRQEIDILKGIVKFGDVTAKQIMRSRVDVISLEFDSSFQEVVKTVKESGFSRIPVYKEDLDNVTGILYVKDLISFLNESPDFEWQSLIRTNVFYAPETKKINDLLKEFQSQKLHLSVIVDEYGGTAGIVTLEDILEEVIGEIRDEFDDDEGVEYEKIDAYNYVFEGKTMLNDVCRILQKDTNIFDEIKGDADSIAGLLLEILGQIPAKDVEVSFNEFTFKILSVNKRRIEKIKITLTK